MSVPRTLFPIAVLSVSLFQVACSHPDDLRIAIDHPDALADIPVHIEVLGASANERVTLHARTTDAFGSDWRSEAVFVADEAGTVDVAVEAPVSGTYRGVDAMGLFWSMRPQDPNDEVFVFPPEGARVDVIAESDGEVARQPVWRRTLARGVTVRPLRPARDGVYGRYYAPPPGDARGRGVVVFGGSEGGLGSAILAGLLASHGFPTLALAYFHEPGLPTRLSRIPLEYFVSALTWLGRQPDVRGRPVIWGVSRGSEAALLVGADFAHAVSGVVALVPSDLARCSLPTCSGPAWTLGGRAVPYAHGIPPISPGNPGARFPSSGSARRSFWIAAAPTPSGSGARWPRGSDRASSSETDPPP